MKGKIIYSQEQIDSILEYNKNGLLNREIADIIGVSKSSIGRLLNSLGVESRHPKLTDDKRELMRKLYLDGYNLTEIGKATGSQRKTVRDVLVSMGVQLRSLSDINKKYSIDENYFDLIDTEGKAYFLGFIYADGTISGEDKHSFSISLQEGDVEVLNLLKEEMKASHPLHYINYKKKSESYQNQYCFSVVNRKIWSDLQKHGVVQRKSYLADYPNGLPDELFRHFVRGLLDGDGTIGKNGGKYARVSILGTTTLAEKLCKKVQELSGISCHVNGIGKNRNPNTKMLNVYSSNALKFLDWIYGDAHFYLKRKHEKYLSFKAT